MAIKRYPQGDRSQFAMIRSFQPANSGTVVWVQNMETGNLVYMLRWGGEIYLPVFDGMKFGLGVFNGNDASCAYPLFVEGRNIWIGGPTEPEACSPDFMWELRRGDSMVMDKLVHPHQQAGRPFEVTPSGFGVTIGEASFHTETLRGQICLYERLLAGRIPQRIRQTNQGQGEVPKQRYQKEPSFGGLESLDPSESVRMSAQDFEAKEPQAGIGAGEEVFQHHHDTGLVYGRQSLQVIFLQVEYRQDLLPMLNGVWNWNWTWEEELPQHPKWWNNPWNWGRPSTAPEIPLPNRPHRPRRA